MNVNPKILALLAVLAWTGPVGAEDVIRPELGRPLQAAQELIKAKKFHDALDKLHEADGVTGKSAYETLVVEQLRLVASLNAGDGGGAAKAYEALAATGRLAPADQQRYELAVANSFYQAKDYAGAIAWGKRYAADGGSDGQAETLLVQSQYLSGDYAGVVKTLKLGDHPSETQLQILGSSYLKLNDTANYTAVLIRLVASYPKDEYWADAIHRVAGRPGFADRLGLDVGRLELALGRFKSADQYIEHAELALQAGLPAEAKEVLTQGAAKGVLGNGADAARHQRLLDAATKAAAADAAAQPKEESDAAAAKDGNALVAVGLNALAAGQAAKAAQLTQQGVEKGGLKHPDEARLHWGIALVRSGNKAKAAEVLHQVQSPDGAADLAQLWLAYLAPI